MAKKRENIVNRTFNDFCYKICDGLYQPGLPDEQQGSGYLKLKEMVVSEITPASMDETKRWENNPTIEELNETPPLKYLRFLHPNLRSYVIDNWGYIKKLEL